MSKCPEEPDQLANEVIILYNAICKILAKQKNALNFKNTEFIIIKYCPVHNLSTVVAKYLMVNRNSKKSYGPMYKLIFLMRLLLPSFSYRKRVTLIDLSILIKLYLQNNNRRGK